MAHLIDGKIISNQLIEKVKVASKNLIDTKAIVAGLAVVIIGEDPASQVYVAAKSNKAKECYFHSVQHSLPLNTLETDLLALINDLNHDHAIHGILVQLPLPSHINTSKVIQAIAPHKDVDGFHYLNVGKLGSGNLDTAFVPCTPAGAMILLKTVRGEDLSNLHAVVVGRSNIVGKPMANLLLAANATVTIAHSKTLDLPSICKTADILVAAVGRPLMIKADWVKKGATIIDVGINRIPALDKAVGKTRLVGDVDFKDCEAVAAYMTPVPGGVGPMTIAMLMTNTLVSAYRSARILEPKFD
jgi:methylenetetrahydrofolate dehydrogenase (NADP+) / methenyltetrahydrofolate cyclohydrolase